MIVTDVATDKRETTDTVHVIAEEPDRAYAPNVGPVSRRHHATGSNSALFNQSYSDVRTKPSTYQSLDVAIKTNTVLQKTENVGSM